MTARDTYNSSVTSAEKTKLGTLQTATVTLQESINAVGVNAGKPPAFGYSAADDLTIRNACKTYQTTALKAEHDKQVAVNNARSTLQGTGDVGPA
jgi:hypothetical protein